MAAPAEAVEKKKAARTSMAAKTVPQHCRGGCHRRLQQRWTQPTREAQSGTGRSEFLHEA
jgi:hypothetical protein